MTYSEPNNVLNLNLPAFLAEAFDSNNLVARLRLDHSIVHDKWTYGPLLGFVYRDRNGYDTSAAQFVPGKTIISGGAQLAYALNAKSTVKVSAEYFHAVENNNPGTDVGTVRTNGAHIGLIGSYAF